MKRSSLNPVSAKRKAAKIISKAVLSASDFLDCQGVPFSQHHKLVDRRSQVEIVRNGGVLKLMRETFPICFNCGAMLGDDGVRAIELHHIIGGSGRSDVRTNLMPLCVRWGGDGCHDLVKTAKLPQGRLLWRKVVNDPDGTDWVVLARLAGVACLPDLITD